MVVAPDVVALGDLARAGDLAADRELTLLAGSGSFAAQRELLTILIGDPEALFDRSFAEVARLELLARFIAIRGNILDVRRLAGILWQMARTAPDADTLSASALDTISLLRGLADEGDGVASLHLAEIAETFPDIWAIVEASELANPVGEKTPPPPIITPQLSLGDILEQALTQLPRRPGWRGFLDRCRARVSGLYWRLRFRLADILEGHA